MKYTSFVFTIYYPPLGVTVRSLVSLGLVPHLRDILATTRMSIPHLWAILPLKMEVIPHFLMIYQLSNNHHWDGLFTLVLYQPVCPKVKISNPLFIYPFCFSSRLAWTLQG